MKHNYIKNMLTALLLLCSTVASAQIVSVGDISYKIFREPTSTVRGAAYVYRCSMDAVSPKIVSQITYYSKEYDVTYIGESAFADCTKMTHISIPNHISSIKDFAFRNCTSLKSIEIIDLGAVGSGVFCGCSSLESITGYDNEKFSFDGNCIVNVKTNTLLVGCKNTVIPSSVTSIASLAYANGPQNVIIPKRIVSIGGGAFACSGVESIVVEEGHPVYDSRNDCNAVIHTETNEIVSGCNNTVIPNSVTSIASYAFYDCDEIESIEIPKGVTSIGSSAFAACGTLNSVIIPSSVLFMGNSSLPNNLPKVIFLGNTPPKESSSSGIYKPSASRIYVSNASVYGYGIEYPQLSSLFEVNGVKYVIKSAADRTCDVIDCAYNETAANIAIDSVVTYRNIKLTVKNVEPYALYKNNHVKSAFVNNDGYVGNNAFYQCTGINSDVVVKNNGYVGARAFEGSTLTGLNISNNGYIGNYAFYDCPKMNSKVTVSNEGYIGQYAFSKSTLTSLNVSSAGEIRTSAFQECTAIVDADISNNGYIGTSAFQGCTALTTLNFGNNVGEFQNQAFRDCTSLPNIVIPDFTPSVGASCFQNCSSLVSAVVGESVKRLEESVFQNCSSLTDVSIGVSVDSIKEKAFSGCTSLPKIKLPQNVIAISDSVFYACNSLKTVIFDDGITNDSISLGSNGESPMFSSCPLDSVYIGRKLSYKQGSNRGYSPFYANKHLRSVTYNDNEVAVYPKEYMNCSNLQNVLIGAGINVIDDEAFQNCTSLPTILIPNTVNKPLGASSFKNCSALYKAVIGDSVASIGQSAFESCVSLVDVKVGARVARINDSAFKNCSSLPQITIPQATNSIANYVFDDCVKLKYFFLEDGPNTISLGKNAASASTTVIGSECPLFYDCALDSIYLGRNLSYSLKLEDGYSPFYFNKTLRAVVIGNMVDSVFENEFYQCRKLEYVSVGDGVTAVGNWAFSSCISLDHFSFGTGLETIGKEAFSDCTSITKIVSSRNVPPVCGDQALADINVWDCTLYVPEDYIETYWAAPQWQDFFFVEGAEYNLKFIVDGTVYNESVVKYNAEITLPADPVKEGYTFLGWSFDDGKNAWNSMDIASNANTMLYTNAPCTTTAYGDQFVSWNVLFDGDANTIFHSEYGNKQTADSLDHYLRVDMGERNKVGKFSFTYTTRNLENNNNTAPKTMVVEGSNVADGEYTEIATLSNLPGTKATVYTSGELGDDNNPFRYIRYRVTETHSNYKDNDHPYFSIAEFGMPSANLIYVIPSRMPADDTEFYAIFKANDYTVKYIVNGEEYYSETVACDAEIVPIEAPEKEGYTFNRWEGLPETMPAGNIEVTAVYDKIPTEVTITINKYGSATFSSPYALDFSEVSGLTAYAATGYNTNTGIITMTMVNTAKEGVGLFLKGAPNTTYVVPIMDETGDNTQNLMVGVLTKTTVNQTTDDGMYVNFKYTVAGGSTTPMFYRYSDGSSVSAGKAYLQLPLSWLPSYASFAIGIRFEDGFATGIDEVEAKEDNVIYYDLNGRYVQEPVKGVVYIVNGKKVIF